MEHQSRKRAAAQILPGLLTHHHGAAGQGEPCLGCVLWTRETMNLIINTELYKYDFGLLKPMPSLNQQPASASWTESHTHPFPCTLHPFTTTQRPQRARVW